MDNYEFTKVDKLFIFIVFIISIIVLFFVWIFSWFNHKLKFKTYLDTIL